MKKEWRQRITPQMIYNGEVSGHHLNQIKLSIMNSDADAGTVPPYGMQYEVPNNTFL